MRNTRMSPDPLPLIQRSASLAEQTMQWDNLEELRSTIVSEGWVESVVHRVNCPKDMTQRPLGLTRADSKGIYKKVSSHPAPDGRVELALRMIRGVRESIHL